MAEADTYTMTSPESGGPGDKLRRAREQAGIAQAEVSAWTKIHERHLSALERGDYGSLPARPYVIGFARTYAHALGLDAEEIVREVREDLDSLDRRSPAKPSHFRDIEDPAKIPSKRLAWIVGFLALAVLVALALLWRSYLSPAAELPPVTAEETMAPPELSPAAQISPTAESAVPAAAQAPTSAAGEAAAQTSPTAESAVPVAAQAPTSAAGEAAAQPGGATGAPAPQLSPAAR